VKEGQTANQDAKCILVVVDTIDCVKKTINDVIGAIIGKLVRGVGTSLGKVLEKFNFDFLFKLPAEVFDAGPNTTPDKLQQIVNFDNLIKLSEIIGLAWVYLLIVTHYFKSILFSLDNDYSSDFVGDMGKMLLGFAGVFLARYMVEAVIKTAQAFASFLFNTPLANGLTIALKALLTDNLWSSFGGFSIALVALAIFVLVYIILFGFVIFKNAKRYFILLVMIILAPIFTPMLFFDMTRTMGMIFWNKFIVTSFSLMFDLLILLLVFVFLGSGGLSLGNLLLILIGMAVVADSNNLIQQIANASEVSGFKSVVRNGLRSGTSTMYKVRSYFK
jgi:type IV secretory pathway VirB6-like protein